MADTRAEAHLFGVSRRPLRSSAPARVIALVIWAGCGANGSGSFDEASQGPNDTATPRRGSRAASGASAPEVSEAPTARADSGGPRDGQPAAPKGDAGPGSASGEATAPPPPQDGGAATTRAGDASAAPPQTPRDAAPEAASPQRVVRAQDVLVDRVRAAVIYAEKIEVVDANIGRTVTSPEERRWDTGSSRKIEGEELEADVLYVKVLKCHALAAREVFAKEVKTGR